MRLRNIPGAEEAILNSEYCIKNPQEQKGHWQDCFDKVQPLHIEIGMGKGRFIMDMAALHPDINFIGIERYSGSGFRTYHTAWMQRSCTCNCIEPGYQCGDMLFLH